MWKFLVAIFNDLLYFIASLYNSILLRIFYLLPIKKVSASDIRNIFGSPELIVSLFEVYSNVIEVNSNIIEVFLI